MANTMSFSSVSCFLLLGLTPEMMLSKPLMRRTIVRRATNETKARFGSSSVTLARTTVRDPTVSAETLSQRGCPA